MADPAAVVQYCHAHTNGKLGVRFFGDRQRIVLVSVIMM